MDNMRIALTYENGEVYQHFGHTECFKVYDVENGEVKVTSVINTNGSGHGALADILKRGNVDALICGGIGDGAKRALAEACITLYGGVTGSTDKAVDDLLAKKLDYNTDITCSHEGDHHHGAHEHGEGHHRGGNCHGNVH